MLKISTNDVKHLITCGTTGLAIAGTMKLFSIWTKKKGLQVLCVETESMDDNPHILNVLVEIETFFISKIQTSEMIIAIDNLLFLEKTIFTRQVEPCMMDRVQAVVHFKTIEYMLKEMKYQVEIDKTPRKVANFYILCDRLVSMLENHMAHIFQMTLDLDT